MGNYELSQLRYRIDTMSDEIERLGRSKYQLKHLVSELEYTMRDVDKYDWQGISLKRIELIEEDMKATCENKIRRIENKVEDIELEIKKLESQISVFQMNMNTLLLEESR
ncbi:MAG: hypothetical protein ACK5LZ_00245 [Anaerorhabdus sp.]